MAKGYTVRIVQSDRMAASWHAKVRRKGWRAGYWVTVASSYGAIEYTTEEAAKAGAAVWIKQNESK
jgi:hypothetical protein